MNFIRQYLQEVKDIVDRIDAVAVEHLVKKLTALRARGGRLFLLGVGALLGFAVSMLHLLRLTKQNGRRKAGRQNTGGGKDRGEK